MAANNDGVDWLMQDVQEIEGLPAEIRAALAGCVVLLLFEGYRSERPHTTLPSSL